MTYADYISSDEVLEPETIREIFPGMPEAFYEKLFALKVMSNTTMGYDDIYHFQWIVLALNGISPNFQAFVDVTPEQIWNAIQIIHRYFPNKQFSEDIKLYVKKVFNNYSLYFYPPGLGLEDNDLLPKVINNLSKNELEDDNFLDRQSHGYLRMEQLNA